MTLSGSFSIKCISVTSQSVQFLLTSYLRTHLSICNLSVDLACILFPNRIESLALNCSEFYNRFKVRSLDWTSFGQTQWSPVVNNMSSAMNMSIPVLTTRKMLKT